MLHKFITLPSGTTVRLSINELETAVIVVDGSDNDFKVALTWEQMANMEELTKIFGKMLVEDFVPLVQEFGRLYNSKDVLVALL